MKRTMQVNRRDFIAFLFRKYCKYMAMKECSYKDSGNFLAIGLENELSYEIELLLDLLINTRIRDYYARSIYKDSWLECLKAHRRYSSKHDYNVYDALLKHFNDCK